MAKISFTKLGLKTNQDIKTIEYNGQNIEVKQYLPIQDKLKLIGDIINQSTEYDTNYANPVKIDVYTIIGIIKNYTNISFTDKQLEDIVKLYDLIAGGQLDTAILAAIPEEEYNLIVSGVQRSIKSFYKYKNSAMGLLDAVSASYDESSFSLDKLVASIKDPEALAILREISPLMA